MATSNTNVFKRVILSVATLVITTFGFPAAAQSAADIESGTLKFALSPEPPFLLTAINTTLQMGMVTSKVMEGLLYLDSDLKPQPLLAEKWDISADGLTYTFKLRPNVKWHDGQPFTSADVSYTILEVLKKVHPRGRTALAKITTVETPDPLTAIIKLSKPAPPMLTALASSYESPMMPKHLFAGSDPASNPYISKPVGTGPFVFKEWKKGDFILLEKNPNYWQAGKPLLRRIVFRVINDASARAASFETGEVHIGGLSPVPLTDMPRIAKNPALSVETRGYAYMSPYMLMEVNLRKPPLNDVRVRRAIAHAIDRDRMTQVVWMGYGKPAVSPIPSQVTSFHSTDVAKYEYSVEKAKKLLDEAGLKPGANGMRFKMTHDLFPLGSDSSVLANLSSNNWPGSASSLSYAARIYLLTLGAYLQNTILTAPVGTTALSQIRLKGCSDCSGQRRFKRAWCLPMPPIIEAPTWIESSKQRKMKMISPSARHFTSTCNV